MNKSVPLGADLSRALFAADLVEGLSAAPKATPPKWFYDAEGSRLFGEITRLPEYYPTRTETALLRRIGPEIARAVGPDRSVVEFGSGSADKAALLLAALNRPAGYVCVEIDPGAARATAAEVARRFPGLPTRGVAGDFTNLKAQPAAAHATHRLGFFPGSTIGNFDPPEAATLLSDMREHLGRGAQLLLGVDLVKDAATLEAAYDDAAGVTAAFNLNLLVRANRELGAGFDLDAFAHEARWNAEASRIEMHLRALQPTSATIDGESFRFAPGETIHTESSYKYTPEGVAALAERGGWRTKQLWTDPKGWFALALLGA
ncbi:L-histidine N(alpha)-methyltransferase [Caulobacter mirabilis]|uniref:L-histidine N(Alpha)-methyltransferase n=1 Tax=Caulobacter mirabilis TaxID=69666 RepID=A0A2D2AUY7_9CAUL|nr:L-histidine N(alpha)-methyltransferase [Caulobacter mirabilis]ATQ41810.1 L-histidine N(alpha)-methyltransferase [Caulobacter mirabilis]